MSKIETELTKATGVTRQKGQTDQTYFAAVARAANKLSEDAFDALTDEAQDWANAAAQNITDAKANSEETTIIPFAAIAAATEDEPEEAEEEVEVEEPAPKAKPKAKPAPAPADEDESEDEPEEDEAAVAESDEEETPDEEESEEEQEADEAPAAKKEPKVPKDKVAKKPAPAAKPAKEPKAEKEKRTKVSDVVRALCIKNPKKSESEIKALADAELGETCSQVTFRCHFSGARGTLKMIEALGRQVVKVPKPE